MSSFAPGLASRHVAASDMLARAFAPPGGFAATEPSAFGRTRFRTTEPAPKHFAPADPDTNPTEGWDPFESAQPNARRDKDAAEAHARGIAEGRAAAIAEIESAHSREVALLDQVSTALSKGAHFDRERMAGHLRQTVLHLVQRLVGEVGIAPDILTARIGAATDMLADSAESALLRVHPDDLPLVAGKVPDMIFPIGDPAVRRGGFVIESASTIVEDGPDLWLEQLAEAIDRVPIPPLC